MCPCVNSSCFDLYQCIVVITSNLFENEQCTLRNIQINVNSPLPDGIKPSFKPNEKSKEEKTNW